MPINKRTDKRCFTLLEVMVALAILALVGAGMGGWRLHRAIEGKRFRADLEKLQSRFMTCQRLAINMQADWEGVLEKRKKGWVFNTHCIDQPEIQKFSPMRLSSFSLFFNDEQKEQWAIQFSATGEVFPSGNLKFFQKQTSQEEWEIPALFSKEAGDKSGPTHPQNACFSSRGYENRV